MNQRLFNAIADIGGVPTLDEMELIINIVHEDHSPEIIYYRECLDKIRMQAEPKSSYLADRALKHYKK